MSVDVMEEHAPHKKNIPSRISAYDEDLDGFNELDRMDSATMEPMVGNQMHNGSVDNNIYASTSMHQQPPQASVSSSHPQQQMQQQQHPMHSYQTTPGPSSQSSVLQELLLSNAPTSMSSPRQQQYNNQFQARPQSLGRSPMTGPNGGPNMMSPPTIPPRPMNPSQQQQLRQPGPPQGNPQMQGGQMYDPNYPMPNQQPHHGYQYQPGQQMVQRPMGGNQQYVRGQQMPQQQQQQQMIRGNAVMNGNGIRKDVPMPPNMRGAPIQNNNVPVMQNRMMVNQPPQQQGQYDPQQNYVMNGGVTSNRPQSTNDAAQMQQQQPPQPQQYYVQQGGPHGYVQVPGQQRPNFVHGQIPQNAPHPGHLPQQVVYLRTNESNMMQGQQPPPQQLPQTNGPQINGTIRPGPVNPPNQPPNMQMNGGMQRMPPQGVQQHQPQQQQHSQQPPQQPQQQPNVVPQNQPSASDQNGPVSLAAAAGAMPPPSSGTPNYQTQDPEKRRLIQQQLVLLLHAHKCQQRERGDATSKQNVCTLPHCSTMKSVLDHMTSCQNGRACGYPHCASSRQIIAHWKNCVKDDCPVCKPLKCFNKGTSNNASFGSPQSNTSSTSFITEAETFSDPFRSPNPPNRPATGGMMPSSSLNASRQRPDITATLGLNANMTNESIGSLPPPDPPAQSKPWHTSINKDLRNHLVGKLVKAIFPSPDPAAMQDQRIKDLISYARKVEKEMFEIASDREEYYHLLAEKIYKIQKELQEKKNRRLEQSQRGDDGSRMPPQHIPSAASIKADIQQDVSRNIPDASLPNSIPDMNEMEIDQEPATDIKPKIEPMEETEDSNVPQSPVEEPPPEDVQDVKDVKPVVKKEAEETKETPIFDVEELRKMLIPVWKAVDSAEEAGPFRLPVDAELLQIPDYYDVIKNPMDLLTMRKQLDSNYYTNPKDFITDMWQMFDNAWLYNRKNSKVYKLCTKLSEIFVEHMNPVMEILGFCCSNRFNFTPLAIICFGQSGCIIARDQTYYLYEASSSKYGVNVSERYIYCQKCFDALPACGLNLNENQNEPPNYAPKDKFAQMKNDNIDAEPFETCKLCNRDWHRICANYYKKVFSEAFICDTCRKAKGIAKPENKYTAKRLPHCKLSKHIESRVNNYINKKVGAKEKDKYEVVIRVLCSTEKEAEVKPLMKAKFGPQGFPEKFPYRTKAVFAFEIVDGVEICFFGLHVQEYGSECKAPNARRVYIAYLDSVHFFQPRELRTDVYHEILLAYLDYVKKLGYTMAHIWACPPSEGDDYIFHCHPPEQKIPKPKRLQDWYKKMLDKGVSENAVLEYKDIHKQAKDDALSSPMELPYFEGDFWPNIIEDCIRDIDKEEADRKREEDIADDEDDIYTLDDAKAKKPVFSGGASTKPSKKSKTLKKAPSKTKKGKGSGSGNEVTDKLLTVLEKHKEVFFTIRLVSTQTELSNSTKPINDPDPLMPSDLMDGRDLFLSKARDEHWEFSSLRRARYSTLCFCHALHTQENKDMNYTCNSCQGTANWHCPTCEDFDLCSNCYTNNTHEHKLEKMNTLIEVDKSADSTNTRNESIQRCIQSLVHACQCRDANCRRVTCHKMKKVVQHTKLCKKRQHTNCPVCKQLIALCCYHAKHCNQTNCAVPFCSNIRQKLQEQKRLQNRRADMLMRRRMDMLNSGMAGGQSQPPATTSSSAPSKPQVNGSQSPAISSRNPSMGKNAASTSSPNFSTAVPQMQQPSMQQNSYGHNSHQQMGGGMGQSQMQQQVPQQHQMQQQQQMAYQQHPQQHQQPPQQQQVPQQHPMRNQLMQQQQQSQLMQQQRMNQQPQPQQGYMNSQPQQQQQPGQQQYVRNQQGYGMVPNQQQQPQQQISQQQYAQMQQQQQQNMHLQQHGKRPQLLQQQPQPGMVQHNARGDATRPTIPQGQQGPHGLQQIPTNTTSGSIRPITSDPIIQTIYDRLKVAKNQEERQIVFKDLKKTPHLFAAFLKVYNAPNEFTHNK